MSSIISFIGWHNSGKTTLAAQVVTELKTLGYRVAVIKSSSKSGIEFDTPDTDTFRYKQAGADSVMLVAPDQMVVQACPDELALQTLAHRYFSDVDIVIAEGFKRARRIPKIEVFQGVDKRLRDEVSGVIAVATDLEDVVENYVFKLNEAREIALFIEKRFIAGRDAREVTALLVNGNKVPINGFIQKALAGTLTGVVETLKLQDDIQDIEIRVKVDPGPAARESAGR